MLTATAMDLRAIAHWASDYLDSLSHEQRVFRIASNLFDLTRDLHGLGPAARNLLRAAAIVHDVGRSVAKGDHESIGAQLVLRDKRLHVGDVDRRALAFLTRYHRGGVPDTGEERILKDGDDRDTLRKLLALLRAADALDSRSKESPRLVFGLKKKRLRVTCYLEQSCPKTRRVYERRKKFRLLEEEMGCTVEVDVRSGDALRLVA
jgi:exopolyphosphatase/guanosine-5'-triphosphate,3'-diphosphate pyrophosphatase